MRCIAHLDMDCFYAQVEAVRLGIDCSTEPYILSQWGNLIAVNYPARKCGIARFNTVEEAKEKCPKVKVSHVATYAIGESEYKYHDKPQKRTHKVALEPYREASRNIFNILKSFEGVEVEKGSVDEAYLDVTIAAQQVQKSFKEMNSKPLDSLEDILQSSTNLIPDRHDEIKLWFQNQGKNFYEVFNKDLHPPATLENIILLGAASQVIWSIRQKIREELHYECSAGIAHNKLLAKCISSRHKPNQQTLLLPDRVASAIWDTPFSDIRGFGGKYGELVRNACNGVQLCREAWLVSKEKMRVILGNDDTEYTYRRLRGYDEAEIKEKSVAKTLMASKAFSPSTSSLEGIKKWVAVLSGELSTRYKEFCEIYKVKGYTLNIKLGNRGLSNIGGVLNKTISLPELVTTESLINTSIYCILTHLKNHPGDLVNSVSLTIGSFKMQLDDVGIKNEQQMILTNFLSKKDIHKRKRSDSNEITVVTLSSSSSSSSSSCYENVLLKEVYDNKEVFVLNEDNENDDDNNNNSDDVIIID